MVRHRKSCKKCKKLSFTGLPPMADGFLDRDNRYVAYPEAGIRTPGFRGSTKKQTSPVGRTEDSRSYQDVERTESTPGLRKGHRRPSAFTQQQKEGAKTNEKADGADETPVGKAAADRFTDDKEQGRDGKIESNNGEGPEKSTDEKLSSKSDSCGGKGEGGLCSGVQEKKSVAITSEANAVDKNLYDKLMADAKDWTDYRSLYQIRSFLFRYRKELEHVGVKSNFSDEFPIPPKFTNVKNEIAGSSVRTRVKVKEFLQWLLKGTPTEESRSDKFLKTKSGRRIKIDTSKSDQNAKNFQGYNALMNDATFWTDYRTLSQIEYWLYDHDSYRNLFEKAKAQFHNDRAVVREHERCRSAPTSSGGGDCTTTDKRYFDEWHIHNEYYALSIHQKYSGDYKNYKNGDNPGFRVNVKQLLEWLLSGNLESKMPEVKNANGINIDDFFVMKPLPEELK